MRVFSLAIFIAEVLHLLEADDPLVEAFLVRPDVHVELVDLKIARAAVKLELLQ